MIVNVCSPTLDVCDSYGRKASELVAGLSAHGWHVNVFDGEGVTDSRILPAVGGILLGYPTLYLHYGAMCNTGPRIAICVFESTKIPDGWAEAFNRCDAVIVHSQFLVDVYRRAGVTVPIHVIPLGVSAEFRAFKRRERATPFTFIGIGDRGDRKGWKQLGFAFNKAFGDDNRYKLIIKAREFSLPIGNPNIQLLAKDLSNQEMAELYHQAHVMVFPTCGEGFGIPPREFAATGGLAMATNWGGTADDLSQWGIPIPYKLTTAWTDKKEWYGKLGQWAEVNPTVLADVLRHVAEHYEAYSEFMVHASEFAIQKYDWSSFTNRVKTIYENLLEEAYDSDSTRNHQTA